MGGESDVYHNGDHHVLLEVEFTRVEAPCITDGGELPDEEDPFPEFTGGEGKELSSIG